jgi:hypothetical protein
LSAGLGEAAVVNVVTDGQAGGASEPSDVPQQQGVVGTFLHAVAAPPEMKWQGDHEETRDAVLDWEIVLHAINEATAE